ncbi:hypothetical protein [Rhodococcus marinonascens]|uniref:hypothetical protein n=1 Tax=Rhodococcus marinonascens TaxID=38311 RepID=UPI000AE3BF28|nr:hypothetical protein [Rhodococcus marinonascens]
MSSTILPIHPITGLTALGMTRRGPIWPVLGGNGEGDGDTGDKPGDDGDGSDAEGDPDESVDTDVDGESDERDLGDKGKRALDNMKSKWKCERTKRQELEQRISTLESGGDDADSTQRDADQSALAKANVRIVKAEIRAAAAGKLSDPSDALKFLDLEQFEVGDDGEIDEDEIAEAITELVEKKPYLAAQGGTRKAPKPDRRQGGGEKDTAGSVASGLATYKARHKKN